MDDDLLLPAPFGVPGALTPRTAAPRALGLAAATGVLGATLLVEQPLGLNLVVLTATVLAALAWIAHRTARPITIGAAGLGALALVLAACTSWRSAPPLLALDLLALLTVLLALVPALRHGDALAVDRAGPLAYVGGAVGSGLRVAVGAPTLTMRAFESGAGPRSATVAGAGSLVRGVVLAVPVLLLFGALLTAADQTFARWLEGLVAWDMDLVVARVVIAGIVAWGAAGMLHAALLDVPTAAATPDHDRLTAIGLGVRERLRAAGIGVREVTVAIALVDLLFLAFGVLQVRWLFGGAASLGAVGLTVAEYARSGFFELVAVSALVLPLLLLANGVLDASDGRGARRAFRAAAGALIGLVLVLLVSAADRMRLYQAAFGLTEQRVYASAFELWLGMVFVWAGATLLRGKAAPFALGALVSGWGFVLALNVYNPDARIARVNLARGNAGRVLDASYLRELSTDAAPAMAAAAPALFAHPEAQVRCEVQRALVLLGERAAHADDWRSWSWSRVRAREALRTVALPDPSSVSCP
ncbi:MAG: DUF4173 domain-containing protein [Gemmatimonadaceae bacterium]|jgi:hypothetical protein|nr:DUF4173 domain-containing protein [Gemmatimonadaceae bacterium]